MAVLEKHAETSAPVHDIIGKRWSPRAFDSRPVEHAKLRSLFEAARWAASSYNGQPWHFLVASKDEHESYKKILESFVEFNQSWAKNAPVLAISVAALKFAHNGEPNRHAFHDVGQAAATLALEASNLGLQVHQMAGILPDKAKQLQANQQKLQTSGSVMNDAARSQLEKEIERQQKDGERFQQDAQAEVQELQQEVQNEFVKKLTPIIDQLAAEKGLQLVFNAGQSGISWAAPGLDLTPDVIKKLDGAKAPATPKP